MENIKPVTSSDIKELIKKYSPYFKEARKRLIFTLFVFGFSTIIGFTFYEQIIRLLIGALSLEGVNIVFTSPFQFINLAITCGISTGLIVGLPILIYQILHFLKPALKFKEYKMILRFLPLSLFLFVGGFVFGSIIMRWQIEIFLTRSVSLGIGNILDISGLLSTVFLTSAIMGIGFQFPIILLIFLRLGLIKHKQLSKKRPWAYLISFIFTLFLPPDSILADLTLTLPLVFLFELTLFMDWLMDRKKS